MPDQHAVRSRGRKDLPVGGALNVASHPEFTDTKILKNGRKASKVILVCMCEGDNVNLFEPARPQVRRNDILTNINAGAHAARMKRSEFAAPIDEHSAPARKRKKKAVALADVKHRQFQTLRRETRLKRMRRDDGSSGEQGDHGARWPPGFP